MSFSGTAIDTEEGDLTSSLGWVSSLDGVIGSGGSVTTTSLSVGSHSIMASVTDLGGAGATGAANVTIQCDFDHRAAGATSHCNRFESDA